MIGSDVTIDREAERRLKRLENPDALERDDNFIRLFAQEHREQKPWRDPDRVADEWADCDTLSEVADALDCTETTASQWLHAWGLRPEREQWSPADIHNDVTPEDLGLEPLGDSAPDGRQGGDHRA